MNPPGVGIGRYGRDTTAMEVARDSVLIGRVVVVTGASSGLGVETARALAAAGADLVRGVRNPAAGELVAAGIREESGRTVRVLSLDLSDLGSVNAFAEQIRSDMASIEIGRAHV